MSIASVSGDIAENSADHGTAAQFGPKSSGGATDDQEEES